jgi:hypothetical protein
MDTDPATPRIRRAGIDDADALSRFARRTFSHTFAADNDPADMAAYWWGMRASCAEQRTRPWRPRIR